MSKAMVARFHGLIRALIPTGPTAPVVPNVEQRIEEQVRRMMRYMQPFIATGFLATLVVLDMAPRWMGRSWKRLQDLPPEVAGKLLSDIQHGPIAPLSDLVVAARAAVMAPYYDLEEVGQHIGWDPAPFMEGRVALRARLLMARAGAASPDDAIGPFSATAAGASNDSEVAARQPVRKGA